MIDVRDDAKVANVRRNFRAVRILGFDTQKNLVRVAGAECYSGKQRKNQKVE